MMMQPLLTLEPPPEKRPHKRVRATSRAAYHHGRETFVGRKAIVLRWLSAYWNRFQTSPTSAELVPFVIETYAKGATMWHDHTALVLYVRRGLSDLKACGVVEVVGDRPCKVNGTMAATWRVREIGSDETR